jgi:methionyl-tRNA formyltransferase
MTAPTVGVALNFDQILSAEVLNAFASGVINCHASRLPRDRGISPALWAFARGDPSIWVSIYRMDSGLDTGPLLEQFEVELTADDTAFSAYKRVCERGGEKLAEAVDACLHGRAKTTPQEGMRSRALSWPDHEFDAALRTSKRRLLRPRDIALLLGW